MISYCTENLTEIQNLCEKLHKDDFSSSLDILSGSSLGQHIRHIVELYQTVEKSAFSGIVNYDQRERDSFIEADPMVASEAIASLLEFLKEIPQDKSLILIGDFGKKENTAIQIQTSLFRELAYNLEHAIHHQALLKIGLIYLGLNNLISSDFGVAPATIRFRKSKQILQES